MKLKQGLKSKLCVFLAITGIVILSSCEKRYGCTDMNALNYDPYADLSDGSCYYVTNPTPVPPSSQNPIGVKITKVELLNISLCGASGQYWDGSQWDYPDVRITLTQNNTSVFYESHIVNNVLSHTFNNINLNLTNLQIPLSIKIEELDVIGTVTVLPIDVMLTYNFQIANWSYSSTSSTMTVNGSSNLCAGNTADMKVRVFYTWIY